MAKLINQTKSHPSMLEHVIKGKVLDAIIRGVDVVVGVFKGRFDDKCRGIASLGGGGVVGAGVPTLRLDPGDAAVLETLSVTGGGNILLQLWTGRFAYLFNYLLDEGSQTGINVIHNDTNTFGLPGVHCLLNKAGHVLLKHGLDVATSLLVVLEDGPAAKQTALLGAVPVKLNGIGSLALGNVFRLQQGPENLHDGNGAAAIVVGARRREDGWQPQVDGVLMGPDNYRGIRLARDGGNDRVLLPRVGEALHMDMPLGTSLFDDAVDLLEHPIGRL